MRALALLTLLAACTPDFASQNQVTDLRILAVEADPPEAQFDLDAGTVDSVHLTILAVDPARPNNFATLDAQLCAPTDSLSCDAGFSIGLSPVERQGGSTFSADLSVPAGVLQQAAQLYNLGSYDGIRVQYSFSVDDGDPYGPQAGEKTLIYSPAGGTPNHNPTLAGIQLNDGGMLLPGDTLTVAVNVDTGMRPVLTAGSRETYTTTDLTGKQVTLTEDPTYAFYTTAGAQFDTATAYEPLDGGAPSDGLTRFTATQRASGTAWVVVRDGRGGESWLTVPWTTR